MNNFYLKSIDIFLKEYYLKICFNIFIIRKKLVYYSDKNIIDNFNMSTLEMFI